MLYVLLLILYYIYFFLYLQLPLTYVWADGLSALKDALSLEAQVTRKIRDIAIKCEAPNPESSSSNFNDYHVSSILFYLWHIMHLKK